MTTPSAGWSAMLRRYVGAGDAGPSLETRMRRVALVSFVLAAIVLGATWIYPRSEQMAKDHARFTALGREGLFDLYARYDAFEVSFFFWSSWVLVVVAAVSPRMKRHGPALLVVWGVAMLTHNALGLLALHALTGSFDDSDIVAGVAMSAWPACLLAFGVASTRAGDPLEG